MTNRKRVYIAGPISSDLEHYQAKFAAAAAHFAARGYEPVNPAENSIYLPQELDITSRAAWLFFMRQGLSQLLECQHIHLLPGWEKSEGARYEALTAQILGITRIELTEAS